MRRHSLFVVILLVAAVVRFVILCISQTHVTSDEAIIGIMGKHILEGRYFPFYFYGVSYNASCAWEAYLAVMPFAIFGVGVIALKLPIVVLSLVCLTIFYRLAERLYGLRPALLAAAIFAFWPGLLKWHFQPRGYAFYFLAIPVLILFFLAIESREPPKSKDAFFFGLASGISIWGMELTLIMVAALWILLLLRRKFSWNVLAGCSVGFLVGYAPAIWWNLTHAFRNWHFLFIEKPEAGGLAARFGLSVWKEIFMHEMPKFFSVDTVLWYYPKTSLFGYIFYSAAIIAIVNAAVHALRWKQIREALKLGFTSSEANKDLLLLVLIGVCFMPYIIAPLRVPGYFLASSFFISMLLGLFIVRSFNRPGMLSRLMGGVVVAAGIICGVAAIVETGAHNQIETLTLCHGRQDHCMTRIPGADIDEVKEYLKRNQIRSVWTTISFVYPLIFESGEEIVASESIFGVDRPVYPPSIPKPEPSSQDRSVFVIESNSPYRAEIEAACAAKGGAAPRITEHGKLSIIEQRFASEL